MNIRQRIVEISGPEDRAKVVKIKKLCSNWLKPGHGNPKDCPSRFRYQRCHLPHHTSLNKEKLSSTQPKTTLSHTGCLFSIVSSKDLPAEENLSSMDTESLPFVFLKTAVATVSSHIASSRANLLINEGSQLTFITANLVKLLHLCPIRRVSLLLSGFKGLSTSSTETSYYDVGFFLLHGLNGERILIQAVVLNNCWNFRRPTSNRSLLTLSSPGSPASSSCIIWDALLSRHLNRSRFILVHRGRNEHSRQRTDSCR